MFIESILFNHGFGGSDGGGGGGMALLKFNRYIELPAATKTVNIDIPVFKKGKDILLISQNGTWIHEGVHFSISDDSKTITRLNEKPWDEKTKLGLLMLSSVPSNDLLNTVLLTNEVVATKDGQTSFDIGIDLYNPDSDVLQVKWDIGLLDKDEHYKVSADGKKMSLNGWFLNKDDKLRFYVWKRVKRNISGMDVTTIPNDSISNIKLHPTIKIGDIRDSKTKNKENVIAIINEIFDRTTADSILKALKEVHGKGSGLIAEDSTKINGIEIRMGTDGLEYKDGNGVWKPMGGGIKDVQRGTAAGAGNVTITGVNPSKTFVRSISKGSAGSVMIGGGTLKTEWVAGRGSDRPFWYEPDTYGKWTGGTDWTIHADWPIVSSGSSSTNLIVKEYGAKLVNATTLYCDGPCEFEVVEFM